MSEKNTRSDRHDAIIERLARVAWEAVPLLLEPIDGFFGPDDPALWAALTPGPPTWDQAVALWPGVAEDYRTVARAVASAVDAEPTRLGAGTEG